jgi:acylphosphatase
MANDQKALHVTVTGLVQGVGFRYSTKRAASRLHVAGWVRNRPDGSVEVFAQGKPESVEKLRSWLQKGPPGARVDNMDARQAQVEDGLQRFGIEH